MLKKKYEQLLQTDKVGYICLFIIISLGIFFRFHNLMTLHTNYDDIGVAASILSYDGLTGLKRMRFISDFGWTYGPLQLLIPCLFLKKGMSYETILFIGRVPSLVFGILAIVLTFFCIRNVLGKDKKISLVPVLGTFLISFSWENIIYSAQMEPYEIGVFFSLLILVFLLNEKVNFFVPIVMALACYAQYQLFIFVFAFYITLFIKKRKNLKDLLKSMICSVISFVLCIPLLVQILKNGMLTRGTNWNVGPDSMFLFEMPKKGIIDSIGYIFKFWIENLIILYKTYFVSNLNNFLVWFIACALLVISIYGIVSLHKSKKFKYLAYYIDLVLGLFIGMISMGKLALSPTRHNIILIPVLILMICYGLQQIIFKVNRLWIKVLEFVLFATIAFVFLFSYAEEKANRSNWFSTALYNEIINQYTPDYICTYGYVFDIDCLNFEEYKKTLNGALWYNNYLHKINEKLEKGDIIVVMGKSKIQEENLNELLNYIQDVENNVQLTLEDIECIKKEEYAGRTAVEYATDYYGKESNGFCLYVYKTVS